MTDSFVTQCPHCQTRFRVSHAQLNVARGVVRCGSCLQVFNAARQLLEQRAHAQAPKPEQPAAAEHAAEAPRAISQKQWTAHELDLDNLDLEMPSAADSGISSKIISPEAGAASAGVAPG